MIDFDTRHALGEYYTPDWLCERIVNEFNFTKNDKILDPACGSGSFLRAAIHRIKETNSDITVEEICDNIYGIDIHPLSVQIAKTTMLLALGKDIKKAKKPVHVNIIQANSLLAPEGITNIFGGEFMMYIDNQKVWLNTQVFENLSLFDGALNVCEDLAEQSLNQQDLTLQTFKNNLGRRFNISDLNESIIDSFYRIYKTFKLVKEKGRDSIWKFIVQNIYKPYFLNKKFDYVIGNPPWFTFSSIKNEKYQNQLSQLAENQNVKPARVANFPHLEIASIFMSYCSSYYLKEKGKLAFVLPRSFFSADQHDNTRSGEAKGIRITKIWDLNDVTPLFNIPSCVFFTENENVSKSFPENGVDSLTFKGNLPYFNCKLNIANNRIVETNDILFFVKLGKSTAFSRSKIVEQNKKNPYKDLFKQGATIVPRAFYFVKLNQDYPPDWDDRIINVETPKEIYSDGKKPWKGFRFSARIESNFIFLTALAKSILPFALFRPSMVVLPILIENKNGEKEIKIYSADELLQEGYSYASRWFRNTERNWDLLKTEKNKKISASSYLNWINKLTDQNLNSPFLVIYSASAKDANATIVKREDMDLDFIVESAAYVCYPLSINEAYYLTAVLNSATPNLMIKDFQAKGLFGPRHVSKKILDVYFPKFDEKNKKHLKLSEISKEAHEKVALFLKSIPSDRNIEGLNLGNLRLEIRNLLKVELEEIDRIVKEIILK